MKHEAAINEYKERLSHKLGDNLIVAKLFGSVARGTDTPESDIDILVLLEDVDERTRDEIVEATVDVNVEHDVVICPVVMTATEYKFPLFQETSFYQAIEREGIVL
ncbi:putative nucleotidyltransferases [Desulfitobacterium sp. LBE]|uniref:DNA polymerase III subunit beta n=3 Tax=root TaxID=1 RepID=A0A098B6P5_DESHA|nr:MULTISPECIES: nucleotidyltransferase domain-containing protein [Desulfitobacterium]EHL06721.1 nucleotidyltransferase domain protein [Desulfitobacterium hafniense DP7]KTE89398.1 DNA polymerase III subunit beta [Desulfitobacterium hafniense]MEA5023438.1 nucleotidyltransferase domain-containing protein [Desulfitobacterium hafniense]TWH57564.1 putative nucleotidyltransferases [Desulfitobacterium sp. LBE]CDX04027.1 RelA/SpoT [Desulfitobacterium hafniense]